MPPTGGQGAAMAFEDALTLADTLTSVTAKEKGPQYDIRQWQAVRQARITKILAFTSKGGDMRKHSVSTFQQLIKEWAMYVYFLWIGKEGGLAWIYEYDTKASESR